MPISQPGRDLGDDDVLAPTYGSRYMDAPAPAHALPERGMPPRVAAQLIRDEMTLDGNPELNLATFVTTWMEPEAAELMTATLAKNYIDQDEYPQTTVIQNRCVAMLAELFHAPKGSQPTGTGTVGSSEAIQLAGLAMKWRWRARQAAAGKPTDRPNIVMGANVQVVWEKFARYFDVEPRYVPLTATRYVLGVPEALALVDENTIGVVAILGSTYTGEYEPVEQLNDALAAREATTGQHVPIHVDAASGGFVAPFTEPELRWDFRLPLVRSINVSGHKYGLVYPGIGWALWREPADVPPELVFHVNYLGGDEPTFSLNFSKGAGQVIAQYYNFLRLGRSGYTDVMLGLHRVAGYLTQALVDSRVEDGHFELVGGGVGLPVVCLRLHGEPGYTVFDISKRLRQRGWIVPAYTLAADAQDIAVLRVVVREGLSRDMADALVRDLRGVVADLDDAPPRQRAAPVHAAKTRGVC